MKDKMNLLYDWYKYSSSPERKDLWPLGIPDIVTTKQNDIEMLAYMINEVKNTRTINKAYEIEKYAIMPIYYGSSKNESQRWPITE